MSKGSYPVHDKRGNLVGREVYVEGEGWVYRPSPEPMPWMNLSLESVPDSQGGIPPRRRDTTARERPHHNAESRHRRTRRSTAAELGYSRVVCAECGMTWPCHEFVKATCERNYLIHGLGCECGWHDDEKVVGDPEQEKALTQSKRDAGGR